MKIAYARDWVRASVDGGPERRFPPGSHWPADDPFVLANPGRFSEDVRYHLAFSVTRDWYLDPALPVPDDEPAGRKGGR